MNLLDGALPRPSFVRARPFLGEPRALAYLAFTRGLGALLLLRDDRTPGALHEPIAAAGHVERVAGFTAFRTGLETVFGPMSTLALASQIFGLYTGFVYFTPVLGGIVADRWIGQRNAVVLGAVLMSAGHIAMAFDGSFLLALLLLIVGCGFLKVNISTQVGGLYAENDSAGRTRGFSIFSIGITGRADRKPTGPQELAVHRIEEVADPAAPRGAPLAG